MRELAERELLDIWDRGSDLHLMDRSLIALHAAFPATSYHTLAGWPLGARNRALAELFGNWFGPGLEAWAACDACGEQLEFEMDTRMLIAQDAVPATADSAVAATVGSHRFRLPSSRDLALAAREPTAELAAASLLRICWIGSGEAPSFSDREIEEAGEQLALADPLAEARVRLTCPGCGREWDDTLDLALFVWAEVEARAKRLLLDVSQLACAYGWTEGEILALSERRRRFYLDAAYP
ncbi:MAG TPA: hypothetical protein VK280_01490 [Streptosporangiaceae bacterium]|nr:hypothetical protein [Streptosporangiaceae bacterium]